ncbi:MAG: hypothetical protein JSR33_12830 [Proteobacteria bacterium]|nr:hypothetical protein [Pseudomonadota bacterium]
METGIFIYMGCQAMNEISFLLVYIIYAAVAQAYENYQIDYNKTHSASENLHQSASNKVLMNAGATATITALEWIALKVGATSLILISSGL